MHIRHHRLCLSFPVYRLTKVLPSARYIGRRNSLLRIPFYDDRFTYVGLRPTNFTVETFLKGETRSL